MREDLAHPWFYIPGKKIHCTIKSVSADEMKNASLNQLDHIQLLEGYLDVAEL